MGPHPTGPDGHPRRWVGVGRSADPDAHTAGLLAAITAEVDRVASNSGGAPIAGFYTYGEIARTCGLMGFHNQTLVVLALG